MPDLYAESTLTPSVEGSHELTARVTDLVGHVTTSPAQTVYVDDSPPTADATYNSLSAATPSQGEPNTWIVHLSGTVSDPLWSNGEPGIGVPAGGVRVTLDRRDGSGVVSTGTQTATVTGDTWAIEYLLQDADPSGCYSGQVEAVDELAERADLPASQRERHKGGTGLVFDIDGDAPAAAIDWSNLLNGRLGPATAGLQLKGEASAKPVPVVVKFTGGTSSDKTQLVLICKDSSGAWWQVYSTGGLALEPGRAYSWGTDGEPTIHRGSDCEVQLTTTASSDDLSGTVSVCGQALGSAAWNGSFTGTKTVSFRADSGVCTGGNGCSVNEVKHTSGVNAVDVAFTPLTPGSTLFNDVPPSGEVLHFTMDTGQASSGSTTFPDASGNNRPGACSGTDCPVAGQQGHERGRAFFGVDH